MAEQIIRSCIDCAVKNCDCGDKTYPSFCVSKGMNQEIVEESKQAYLNSPDDLKIMKLSAEIEHDFYCQMTRVEETIEWCKRMGARKIGIASCVGLLDFARTFAKVLRFHGFDVYGISCKAGEIPKIEIGIEKRCEEIGVNMCNPILQARKLAEEETDINIVIGLCVGHDSLFYKYSKAPVTTLVTKDRVLGHNAIAALYMAETYYEKKLFSKD